MGTVDGILISAHVAEEWAAFADKIAGSEGERLVGRLEDFFSRREIGLIASIFGSNALRALARTLHTRAEGEETDPDIEISVELGPRK